MTMRRYLVVAAAAGLVLAACGSDSDGDPIGGGSADTAAEQGGAGDDAESTGDDASGAGSNEETQENLDEAGVDLDLDELEESISELSTGEGGGIVTVDGVPYTFIAQICVVQGDDFIAEGPGASPDGTPAWVGISHTNTGDLSGDGEDDLSLDVSVELGKTELFGTSPDDQPTFYASRVDAFGTGAELDYALAPGSISGSGPIEDTNFVAGEFGVTFPMTFEATCS